MCTLLACHALRSTYLPHCGRSVAIHLPPIRPFIWLTDGQRFCRQPGYDERLTLTAVGRAITVAVSGAHSFSSKSRQNVMRRLKICNRQSPGRTNPDLFQYMHLFRLLMHCSRYLFEQNSGGLRNAEYARPNEHMHRLPDTAVSITFTRHNTYAVATERRMTVTGLTNIQALLTSMMQSLKINPAHYTSRGGK